MLNILHKLQTTFLVFCEFRVFSSIVRGSTQPKNFLKFNTFPQSLLFLFSNFTKISHYLIFCGYSFKRTSSVFDTIFHKKVIHSTILKSGRPRILAHAWGQPAEPTCRARARSWCSGVSRQGRDSQRHSLSFQTVTRQTSQEGPAATASQLLNISFPFVRHARP